MADSDFQLEGVVRGHHVYKSVWTPVVGEDLPLQQEPGNGYDPFAVTIMKEDGVVDRVPIELSYSFWTFMQSGGDWAQEERERTGGTMHVQVQYQWK